MVNKTIGTKSAGGDIHGEKEAEIMLAASVLSIKMDE